MEILFAVILLIAFFIICFIYNFYRNKTNNKKEEELKVIQWKKSIKIEDIETDVSLEIEAKLALKNKLEDFLVLYVQSCRTLKINAIADIDFMYKILNKYPNFIENPLSAAFKFTEEDKKITLNFIYFSEHSTKSFVIPLTIQSLIYRSSMYPYYDPKLNYFYYD